MNYEILSIDRLEENEKLIKENGYLREQRNELEKELQDANESISWWQNKYNALDKSNDIWLERINKAIEELEDTSVDMPSTLLIEVIDYVKHILDGDEDEIAK